MKLKDLTQDQQKALADYRARMFAQAISTAPADRTKAETAARRMAEVAGAKVNAVVWVAEPKAGKEAYEAAWSSLESSLWSSLWSSLRSSLWSSLRSSLWSSLWSSLESSLWSSLWSSLESSLRSSLWSSLESSLESSLWSSGWLAFYAFPRDHLGVQYAPEAAEKLALHEAIASSCFALWIVPGTVILCERPATVEVVDGRLVGLTWRSPEVRDER